MTQAALAYPYVERRDADTAEDGRRRVMSYLAWTPLLWLLGLHVILIAAILVLLCVRRWPERTDANIVFGAWLVAGLGQLAGSVYNSALLGEDALTLAGRCFAFNITGWVVVGAAIAAGASHAMARQDLVRAHMRFALGLFLAGLVCLAIPLALGMPELLLPTPVNIVIGDRPMLNSYTNVHVFLLEEWLPGIHRLRLYYPWATGLGCAGICIGLIATLERDRRWQAAGWAACLLAVVTSGSRNALIVLPLSLGVIAAFRLRGPFLAAVAAAAVLAALGFAFAGFNPLTYYTEAVDAVKESRAGSSMARDLIYDYSWRGFLQSPWFGQGWVGDSIISQEELPIGSHSTLYGTLYTGGVVAFASLVLATATTIWVLAARALRENSREAAAATAMMFAFVTFSYGEGIYSLVLPCIPIFLFIGGALAPDREPGA